MEKDVGESFVLPKGIQFWNKKNIGNLAVVHTLYIIFHPSFNPYIANIEF